MQLSSTGAALPLLLRHGDLTKCRWNPGLLLRLFTTVLLGRTPASSSLATGRSPPRILPAWSRLDSDKASSLPSSAARTTSRRVPCFARRATAAAASTLSPQKVAVVSASSSTCWLEFFDRRSFFSAPPATAVHRLLNLRVDVGLEPVGPAPQVLLPLVRLHIGLLASCQFHPAEASSHWLTLPRGQDIPAADLPRRIFLLGFSWEGSCVQLCFAFALGLLASCQFHPAEAISHWLTLPRGGLGF